MTKNEVITKTLAEMNQGRADDCGSKLDPNEELDREEVVIVTLREELPDDELAPARISKD